MSKLTIESEKIAEIREALQVIQGNAELIRGYTINKNRPRWIINQVKRIDKLLPNEVRQANK